MKRESQRKTQPPITAGQLRAARALLRWTVQDLSDHSEVSLPTIHRFEQVDGPLPGLSRTTNSLRFTLERHGIEFVGAPDDAPGVRLHALSAEEREYLAWREARLRPVAEEPSKQEASEGAERGRSDVELEK